MQHNPKDQLQTAINIELSRVFNQSAWYSDAMAVFSKKADKYKVVLMQSDHDFIVFEGDKHKDFATFAQAFDYAIEAIIRRIHASYEDNETPFK
jgi:predicted negative regulator of RcsB-dependent stress response